MEGACASTVKMKQWITTGSWSSRKPIRLVSQLSNSLSFPSLKTMVKGKKRRPEPKIGHILNPSDFFEKCLSRNLLKIRSTLK